MDFCINCGQQHPDGTRFCRFCGNQQPGEQLLQRLRGEAQQIHSMRLQMQSQQPSNGNPPTASLVRRIAPSPAMALSKLTPHPVLMSAWSSTATEGDLAAYWMLAVDQMDQVENRHIADLGAGNAFLELHACFWVQHMFIFMSVMNKLLKFLKEFRALNHSFSGEWTVHHALVGEDEWTLREVVIVRCNPPGCPKKQRQIVHFLKRHLPAVQEHSPTPQFRATHVQAIGSDHGWEHEHVLRTDFRLPQPTAHHSKEKRSDYEVLCWRFFRPR